MSHIFFTSSVRLQSSSSSSDTNNNNTSSSGVSESFALIVLALLFLWIAIIGSSRVLKVLDRRHYLIGAAQAKARWNNLYGAGSNNININNNNNNNETPLRGSTVRHASSTGSHLQQQRFGTNGSVGSGHNNNAAGVLSSTFTENILYDNRFVFGFFAIVLGIGRAAYVLSFMFLSGGSGGGIAGDNVLADTVTAPLAWFFFSLLAAVLWTLRDLLDRVNSLLNPHAASSHQNQNASSPNSIRGLDEDEQTPSNNNSPSQTPTTPNNKNGKNNRVPPRVATYGSDAMSNYSMATKKAKPTSAESRDNLDEQDGTQNNSNNTAVDDDESDGENNNNNIRSSQDSEDEPAVPVVNTPSKQIASRNKRNNNNNGDQGEGGEAPLLSVDDDESGAATKSFCCSLVDPEEFKKYRTLLTILAMLVIILVSLIFSWVEQKRDKTSTMVQVVPAALSSFVCFALFLWGIACSYESVLLLRSVGMVAHRVAIAIIVMSIFLFVRGLLILPPFQENLCGSGDGESENFWSCTFLYDFVDCAGIALILQILP